METAIIEVMKHTKLSAGEIQLCTDSCRISFFDTEHMLTHPLLQSKRCFEENINIASDTADCDVLETTSGLVIIPTCTTCGLQGDITKPYTIKQSDIPVLPPDGREREEIMKWWDGAKWTGSPFFDAALGQVVNCCRYHHKHPMDAATRIEEDKIDDSKVERNEWGQFVAKGVTGQFCTPFCLMVGMFTFGRCAGCAKKLTANKQYAKWNGEHEKWVFAKYTYCSEDCRNEFSKTIPLSAAHLGIVLGLDFGKASGEVADPESDYRGRCANRCCGNGRDKRGSRVRARVPQVGDFCSTACRKIATEAEKQTAKAAQRRQPVLQ